MESSDALRMLYKMANQLEMAADILKAIQKEVCDHESDIVKDDTEAWYSTCRKCGLKNRVR